VAKRTLDLLLSLLLLAALTARRWGNTGVTFGYLAVSAGIGLPSALTIFLRARREYLAESPLAANEGEAA